MISSQLCEIHLVLTTITWEFLLARWLCNKMLPACDGVKEKQKHTDNVYEMLIINLFTLVLLGFNYIYCYNDPQRLFIIHSDIFLLTIILLTLLDG